MCKPFARTISTWYARCMAAYTHEELINILKEADLRITNHRLAVLSYIAKLKQPATVYEIVEAIRKKDDVDQATVYRNITSLEQAGLLRRMDFNHGHAHYELETGRPTHQLVCNNCETIEKIEGISIDVTVKKMLTKSKKFKKTTTHSIEIYGLCKSCA
jgi:Fur family ferric uptake transcriptional regulator